MTSDPVIIRILWILLSLGITFLLWRIYRDKQYVEPFESSSDISENIIKVFYDSLHRAPTSEELKNHTKAIFEKQYDYNELELRLINSDEYQRLIKTQTNTLVPETTRILEEKDLVRRVKIIYKKVRAKNCPKEMLLPLKDMYIYFRYNIYKFVALLRETKYPDFEDGVMTDANMSRDNMIELYHKLFDDAKLNYDADAIEKMDKALGKNAQFANFLLDDKYSPTDSSTIQGAALLSYLLTNVRDAEARKKAADEEERIRKMQEAAGELEKQRKMLLASAGKDGCTADQRIYLPNESKILTTEHGFRVLQQFPPICIPVGKKTEVADATIFSKLQGTSLNEAQETQVGSIMPKFEYRRYIEVPVPGTTSPPPGTKK